VVTSITRTVRPCMKSYPSLRIRRTHTSTQLSCTQAVPGYIPSYKSRRRNPQPFKKRMRVLVLEYKQSQCGEPGLSRDNKIKEGIIRMCASAMNNFPVRLDFMQAIEELGSVQAIADMPQLEEPWLKISMKAPFRSQAHAPDSSVLYICGLLSSPSLSYTSKA